MLTTVERVLLLGEIDLFAAVPSEILAALAAGGREDRFAANETIYSEGEVGDALHVVVEGGVRLERGATSREIGAGTAFGTWGLLDTAPRRFTATAVGELRLLTIERPAFHDVLSDHVLLAEGVLAVLASRVRRCVEAEEPPDTDEEASLG